MDKDVCFDVLKDALGDKVAEFDDKTLRSVVDEIEKRANLASAEGTLTDVEQRIFKAADDVAKEIRVKAMINQRNAALNILRRETLHSRIGKFKNPVEGLKAILVGIQKGVAGARQSVDSAYMALTRKFQGGLLADLRSKGLLEVFLSRDLDRDVARELWQIRPGGTPGITKSKEALSIAGIVNKWQLAQLQRLNRAGAYIKELQGYVVKQSHDFRKISRAGFEKWYEFVQDKLDWERTFGDELTGDPREVMEQVYWDLVRGKQMHIPEEQLLRPHGLNVAEQVSKHRELHFKTADDWFEYNSRFGNKSLGESIFSAADHAARHIAMMESFGPEPEAMFRTILQDLTETTKDPKMVGHLRGDTRRGQMLQAYFDEVSGKLNVRANNNIGIVARGLRAMNSLSKLGLATISSITDVATQAAELKYQGIGFLEGYANTLKNVMEGRTSGWKREFADMLGAGMEGTLGAVFGRVTSADDLPGGMTRLMQLFFKANGMAWWTDSHKTGTVLMLSHWLGRHKARAFDQLPGELQRGLGLYGIEAKKWEALRGVITLAEDGRYYMDPSGVASLPDDVIKQAFDRPKVKGPGVRRLKDELETAIRAYLVDRVDYAILTPGAAERAYATLGTESGTMVGEAVRMMMQFKQFSISFLSKGWGRSIYGTGADSLKEAFLKGKGDMLSLIHMMAATTAMGYLAMSAKDIVKGKTPRDPTSPKTWVAALVQGGGAGIMGDFMFGEFNRFGSSFLSSMTGPFLGQVESVVELWSKFTHGDDFAAQAVKLAINNTPFINLAYTRPALDYLFLYHLQEAMNPGYLKRMEQRIQRENKQTFLFPPSRYAVGQ